MVSDLDLSCYQIFSKDQLESNKGIQYLMIIVL
jgi:hypothetical protein